jgi:hypothetical protein
MIVAIKYNEDDCYSNNYYSKVGGIALQELNYLESEFLKFIRFDLFVDYHIFYKYKGYLKHYEY